MLEQKSVILITIDALRPDHLKSYGYHLNTAPNLEEFVKNGTTFSNAITNGPETPSAFSALFNSMLPLTNGGFSPLPSQKLNFPQILKENDVFTYGIHSNPNLSKFFNYHRGFDIFLDGERFKEHPDKLKDSEKKASLIYYIKKILNNRRLFRKLMYGLKGFNKLKSLIRNRLPFLTDFLLPFTPIAYNAPYVTYMISNFLKNNEQPLFLWAHYMDVHSPFNPPSKNVKQINQFDISNRERNFLINEVYKTPDKYQITKDFIKKLKILYDAEINYVDSFLNQVLHTINLKFQRDCLVIITSDHGEAFFEHNNFFHQGNVYDELLKIPLFMVEINKKSHIKRIPDIVQLIDIAPTILDYFNIPIPESFQGKSLLPLLEGKSLNRENFTISETYQKDGIMKRNEKDGFLLISIRESDWKYIYNEQLDKELLFNLNFDPGETINLINEEKSQITRFRKIRELHLKETMMMTEHSKISKAIGQVDLKKVKL
jgi:arylsulfatase A-like enzyme